MAPFDWELLPETCNECEHCRWSSERWECQHPDQLLCGEDPAVLTEDYFSVVPRPRWCPME